jgi:tight adherence protein B
MVQAGLARVSVSEFAGACGVLGAMGGAAGYALFGSGIGAAMCALFAGASPVGTFRLRRQRALDAAHEAWPTMIEEIRVLTSGAGRSIPTALFDVGHRSPPELRAAFEAAEREWLMSTDFGRSIGVLEDLLADPTADAVAETLMVAHEIGGADLDRRLTELAEDRRLDVLARRDARSRQAGVRFARRFVIIVPIGMAVAGLSLGDGREAYQQPWGQALVAVGLLLVAACWVWSGQMLKLPTEQRAFAR